MEKNPNAIAQKANLKKYFDSQSAAWDNRNHWNAYYKSKMAEFCRALIPAGTSVLEVGSATGELLEKLMPSHGVGIDFSPAMVEISKKKYPHFEFHVDDIEDLRLSQKFQVVVMSDLLNCIVDIWQAFRHLKNICVPESRIILTYHNHLWEPLVRLAEWIRIKNPTPVQNWVSPSELEEILNLNGFEVIRGGTCILAPLKIPIISEFLNRCIAHLPLIRQLCFTRFIIARPQPIFSASVIPSVSVVVPCLNEKGNISSLLERLPDFGSWMEVIFIDGGSTDGTQEAVQRELEKSKDKRRIRLLTQSGPKGKGQAVRQAFAEAKGDIFMILDADISVAPEDLPKFYQALVEGKGELINGSRLVYSMEDKAMRFLNLIANQFFRIAFSWLLDQPIRDTLCGTKALFRNDYERISAGRIYFGDFDPFGDFDLLFGAARLNFKIANIPVRYNARLYGSTKIHRWKHGWLLLKMCWVAMLKIKFR